MLRIILFASLARSPNDHEIRERLACNSLLDSAICHSRHHTVLGAAGALIAMGLATAADGKAVMVRINRLVMVRANQSV